MLDKHDEMAALRHPVFQAPGETFISKNGSGHEPRRIIIPWRGPARQRADLVTAARDEALGGEPRVDARLALVADLALDLGVFAGR